MTFVSFVKPTKTLIAINRLSIVVLLLYALLRILEIPICPEETCSIVSESARIPSELFIFAGIVFFFISNRLLFRAIQSTNETQTAYLFLPSLFSLYLFANIAEAILLGFQFFVLKTFCWFCVLVATCIILQTLLLFKGYTKLIILGVFITVFSLYTLLDFSSTTHSQLVRDLKDLPVQSQLTGKLSNTTRSFLFVSEDCPHCQHIKEVLKNSPETYSSVTLIASSSYASKKVLRRFGLDFVPVLMTSQALESATSEIRIIRGSTEIEKFFRGPSVSPSSTLTATPGACK